MAIGKRSHTYPTSSTATLRQAIGVDIVDGGDSANPNELLDAALACGRHLFLDPDTGLGAWAPNNHPTHVDLDQFVQVVRAEGRRERLTLVYDQAYAWGMNQDAFVEAVRQKVNHLTQHNNVYAVGYLAEPSAMKLCFIWASGSLDVVTDATRNFQGLSRFLDWRFVHGDNRQ